jgi:hypothetical protein
MKPKTTPVKPDPEDYAAVEREYGILSLNVSDAALANRYRLAHLNKLIRLAGIPTR